MLHTNQKQEVNIRILYWFVKDYTARATELDVQVEKLSKEKKDYVEEIKVSLLCMYWHVIFWWSFVKSSTRQIAGTLWSDKW